MKINIIQFPNGFRHKFVVNCFPSLLWFHGLLSVSLVLVLFACLFVLHQKKNIMLILYSLTSPYGHLSITDSSFDPRNAKNHTSLPL